MKRLLCSCLVALLPLMLVTSVRSYDYCARQNRIIDKLNAQIAILQEKDRSFKFHPSVDMIHLSNTHAYMGMSAVLSDKFGKYKDIDWSKMFGDLNWNDQWMRMKRNESERLYSPPLIVPREYGECVILLAIEWTKQLKLRGMIPPDACFSLTRKSHLPIDAEISISIDGKIIHQQRGIFVFRKSHWSTLFVIDKSMKEDWNLPIMKVQVFPLTEKVEYVEIVENLGKSIMKGNTFVALLFISSVNVLFCLNF